MYGTGRVDMLGNSISNNDFKKFMNFFLES